MEAVGLQTHIWNNNLRSAALLAGFPVLLIGLSMLKGSRRRNRDAIPGAGITSPRSGLR